MSDHSWITISEAAARLGTNSTRIRYLLSKGELICNGCKGMKRRVKWTKGSDSGISGANISANIKDCIRRTLLKGGLMFAAECSKIQIDTATADKLSAALNSVFDKLPEILDAEISKLE